MKKRICAILLCFILLAIIPFQSVSANQTRPTIVDNADLLTVEEELALHNSAMQLQNLFALDIVIVTVWDLDGKTAQEYADDYYDNHGYGYGDDASGILLLLAMESREWYISTCGKAIYIFTDYGLEQMGDAFVPYLSSGHYYEAFECWLGEIPYYYDAYESGYSIDGYVPPDAYIPESGEHIVYPNYETDTSSRDTLISVIVGLIVALVTILIMRSKMNTARFQTGAAEYMKTGSCDIISRRDIYLYSHVTKTAKPQNNGGGSSVHRSSGGRSHGGRGGRF